MEQITISANCSIFNTEKNYRNSSTKSEIFLEKQKKKRFLETGVVDRKQKQEFTFWGPEENCSLVI
jgi:hypothetical protein